MDTKDAIFELSAQFLKYVLDRQEVACGTVSAWLSGSYPEVRRLPDGTLKVGLHNDLDYKKIVKDELSVINLLYSSEDDGYWNPGGWI